MPQTNYTPILIYASSTTGNTPSAGNLTNSSGGAELAINYFDGRLFYKDAAGVVQVLATRGTAAIGGSNTQVQFNSSGSLAGSANMTFDGTTLSVAALADASLTNGRVTYAGAGGNLTDSANLTFDGTSLTLGGNPTLSAGTANGVAYLNGSKVLTTGSALTFDGTNLGIGESGGNIQATYAGTFSRFTFRNGASSVSQIVGDTLGNLYSDFTTAEIWRNSVNGTAEAMRLTSTGLGIGTSSPTSKLTIGVGSFSAAGTQTTGMYTDPSLGLTVLSDAVYFASRSGSGRLILDSSGNLGLEVTPSAWSPTGTQSTAFEIKDSGNSGKSSSLASAGGDLQLSNNAYYDGSGWRYVSATSHQAANYYQSAGTHVWRTAPSGTAGNAISFTQSMTLDASGNLGIGTSSPQVKLEVSDSSAGAVSARITNTANVSQYLSIQMSGGTAFGVPGWDNSGVIEAVADGVGSGTRALYLGAYNGPLIFATGSGSRNERMRLDSSGNLGLGVTPSAWLSSFKAMQIGATAAISENSFGDLYLSSNAFLDSSVTWKYLSSNFANYYAQENGAHLWYNAPSGTAGNAISFTQAMTLNASGNLGIGTSSPGVRLDVSGNGRFVGTTNAVKMVINNTGGETTIARDDSTGSQFGVAYATNLYANGAYPMRFWTDGTERVRIKSTGQLRFVPLAADPAGAEAGDVYYNSGTNKLRLYDGSTWVDLN